MDNSAIIENRKSLCLEQELDSFVPIANYIHSGIDIVGYDYKVLFQNRVLKDKFGDLRGKICYKGYMKRQRPCLNCPMKKAIYSHQAESAELRGPDGRLYEIISTPLKSGNGKKAAIEVITDITEQKLKEESLSQKQKFKQNISGHKKTEGRLRELRRKWLSLIRNIPEVIMNVDREGRILSINHTVKGMAANEAIGKNIYEFMVPEHCDHVKKSLESVFRTGKPAIYTVAGTGNYGSGTAWYETRAIPAVHDDGTPIVTLICIDITERKKIGEALEDYKRRYYNIFEGSRDAIYVATYDGKFLSINQAALKLFGYTKKEILKLNVSKLCLNPESHKILSQALRTRGGVENFTVSLCGKNGKKIECLINANAREINGNKNSTYQAVVNDVTVQERAEAKLKQSLERSRRIIEGTIQAMAKAVEMRDPYTAGHQRRVSRLAYIIARRMKLSKNELEAVRVAGTLHDIGKIYVPSEILTKSRKLNEAEFSLVKEHPRVGYEILKNEKFPWPIAKIVHQHHERIDGSGYPHGLYGKDIMLEARILAVADIVEAMASHRPYRPALGIDKALEEISRNKGILYDPVAVDTCLLILAKKSGFKLT